MVTCPCGTGREYSDCCEPIIRGKSPAPTAETLMRSRYSAYSKREIEYLSTSLHPKKRKAHDPENSREWAESSEWLQLEIVRTEDGGPDDSTGVVEFKAHYRTQETDVEHHEVAEFRREGDDWYFWDGKTIGPAPVKREEPKVGRNDPCPCGSGKKYKKCCGRT